MATCFSTERSDATAQPRRLAGSKTLIGPWSHSETTKVREHRFWQGGRCGFGQLEIRWFDYWPKGKSTGIDKMPSYQIFVMGENKWRDEDSWPLTRALERSLYIESDGVPTRQPGVVASRLESRRSPGRSLQVRSARSSAFRFAWSRCTSSNWDQRPLADRSDILVYQSKPLPERIEVTLATPRVELFASSSAPDTDFFCG
ncbi:MAG: CocE/NonD family hydrolase [Planctomycetaceae bacterium]|nr:CocE/NonD family hydrolase [Planctomycetaceae bacterium]